MCELVQHMEQAQADINIELMVNVLTMGYWPTYTLMDISLPEDVSAVCVFVQHLCSLSLCLCTRCTY